MSLVKATGMIHGSCGSVKRFKAWNGPLEFRVFPVIRRASKGLQIPTIRYGKAAARQVGLSCPGFSGLVRARPY